VTPEQVREAMVAVADLFEAVPECHCADYLAMTEHGTPVHPLAPEAAQWCLYGALFAALEIDEPYGRAALRVRSLADAAAHALFDMRAADANNDLGHEAAVAILRRAASGASSGPTATTREPEP